jgi:hypothetical protein
MKRRQESRFCDLGKEAAIADAIAVGTFELVPAHCLIPGEAFVDPRWRIVYGAALAVRSDRNGICCAESVNDFIAMHDLDREMQAAIDSTRTVSWQKWPEFADTSLALGPLLRPLEYCLGELGYLHGKRQAAEIGERLAFGELEIAQARREFDALPNGVNGSFNFATADDRRFNAEKLHDKPEATILAIPLGKKGPNTKEWQKLTLTHMTPDYLASLNGNKNISVSLGPASQGLCSIDVDNDDELERFLSLNPALQGSLISRGVRGANIWARIKGDYPKSYGLWKKGSRKSKETKFGEWRANGNQAIIAGKHPSGCLYSDNGKHPIEIEFSHTAWPESLDLPWVQKAELQPEQEASRRDIDRELTIKCDLPTESLSMARSS